MRFLDIYKDLVDKKYHIFSFEDLCVFYPLEKRSTLRQYLSRWKKQGWIRSLRKGVYELAYTEGRGISDFYIANKMYAPSYISLETALSYYSIIPEVSMAVVSVTSKITRRFKNAHGLFIYRSIQPEAFRGYIIEKHNGLDVLIAEPEKALVDFLYFKTLRGATFDAKAERIDQKRVEKLNKKKLELYAKIFHLDIKPACRQAGRS
jgi:predicted transcriptional regulator of viral defense system